MIDFQIEKEILKEEGGRENILRLTKATINEVQEIIYTRRGAW